MHIIHFGFICTICSQPLEQLELKKNQTHLFELFSVRISIHLHWVSFNTESKTTPPIDLYSDTITKFSRSFLSYISIVMSQQVEWWEIILFLPYLIMILSVIYGNLFIWNKHRSKEWVTKRNPFLLFGLNFGCFFVILGNVQSHFVLVFDVRYEGEQIVQVFGWCIVLFFLITKNWLIFWRYKWQYYTLQTQWQSIINPSLAEIKPDTNFYLRNNHKYGSKKFVYKWLGIWVGTIMILNFIFFLVIGFDHKSESMRRINMALATIATLMMLSIIIF